MVVALSTGQKVILNIYDTAGQEDYEKIRPISYPETSVFVIALSVRN